MEQFNQQNNEEDVFVNEFLKALTDNQNLTESNSQKLNDLTNYIDNLHNKIILYDLSLNELKRAFFIIISDAKTEFTNITKENANRFNKKSEWLIQELDEKSDSLVQELDKKSKFLVQNLDKKSSNYRKLTYLSVIALIVSFTVLTTSTLFAFKFYEQSILSKQEIRQEILDQIAEENKDVYPVQYVKTLEEEYKIIKVWIENNPQDSKELVNFQKGFRASKK